MTDRAEYDNFEDIVAEHTTRVQRVVRRVVSDPDMVADIVQETFIRAWKGIARFRGDASISTWLHRIAVNTALTARRKAANLNSRTADFEEDIAAEACHRTDPEKRGEVVDLRIRLEAALESLPPGQRAVVVLKDMEGWSHAEISEHLGITESAAKVRLHRAHRRLAGLLEEGR